MDDILLHARNSTTTVVGQTDQGKMWMKANYRTTVTTIPTSVLEDFKKDLDNLKLTYEDM